MILLLDVFQCFSISVVLNIIKILQLLTKMDLGGLLTMASNLKIIQLKDWSKIICSQFCFENKPLLAEHTKTLYLNISITHFVFTIDQSELPYGNLPILEVDGEMLHQSYIINQFLAKRFGKLFYCHQCRIKDRGSPCAFTDVGALWWGPYGQSKEEGGKGAARCHLLVLTS